MNRSGAMEAQQLGPACRDGRQDNRVVIPPLVDQTARVAGCSTALWRAQVTASAHFLQIQLLLQRVILIVASSTSPSFFGFQQTVQRLRAVAAAIQEPLP